MAGLKFNIAQMLQELESARYLTRPFTANGDYVISRVKTQLESLRDESSQVSMAWEIPRAAPLRSITSQGEYEPGGRGTPVAGEFSFVWKIRRVQPARRRDQAKEFQLIGNASTVARILDVKNDGSNEELAMWRIEVGDDNSPGCHFHVQIRGESEEGPFPKRLSVPRLPTCLASPMAALEFLLAELFQDGWKRHVSSETDALKNWRAIQRNRLQKLFEWQCRTVSTLNQISPWSTLKLAKPPADIFVV